MVIQRCEQDSECPSGRVCDPGAGECVECWNDSQCSAGRCKLSTGTCEECTEDSDCAEGVCSLSMNVCVACMKSSDCKGGGVCSRTTYECVQCEQDLDCPSSGPCYLAACYQSKCEEVALPDLALCEDGDWCTMGERCYAGVCQWTIRDPLCEPDGDFDGVTASEGDCRDDDPDVHPGAVEVCDGKDNDCDGILDGESCVTPTGGCLRTGCLGQICSDTSIETECVPRPEYTCLGLTECGPYGPGGRCAFQPTSAYLACYKDLCSGAQEVCDGLDNDCDGLVDEKGVCGPGSCQTECDCYAAPGAGFAKSCELNCPDCGSFWQCVAGQCKEACGEIPAMDCGGCGPEICGNGKDDNCDDQTDEGCECAGSGTHVKGPEPMPCCDGLVPISKCAADGTRVGSLEQEYFCTPCGDGVCAAPESDCNCPADCAPVTPVCLPEGATGQWDSGVAAQCCEGLSAVPAAHAVSEGKGVVCESNSAEYVCTKCGDGQCGAGENGCRCPQDCELELCAVPEEYLWVELSGLLEGVTEWLGLTVATAGVVSMGPVMCTQLPCPPMLPCCNTCVAPLVLDSGEGGPLPLLAGGMELPGCMGTNCDAVLECAPLPLESHVVVYGLLLGPAPFGLAVSGFCLEPSAVEGFMAP